MRCDNASLLEVVASDGFIPCGVFRVIIPLSVLIVILKQTVNFKTSAETNPGKPHSEEISDRATEASILNPWHRLFDSVRGISRISIAHRQAHYVLLLVTPCYCGTS